MEMDDQKKGVVMRCVACGMGYVLTPGERDFYEAKGLCLPKRCAPCRQQRRATLERLTPSGAQR
jgi:hypothetical protein